MRRGAATSCAGRAGGDAGCCALRSGTATARLSLRASGPVGASERTASRDGGGVATFGETGPGGDACSAVLPFLSNGAGAGWPAGPGTVRGGRAGPASGATAAFVDGGADRGEGTSRGGAAGETAGVAARPWAWRAGLRS